MASATRVDEIRAAGVHEDAIQRVDETTPKVPRIPGLVVNALV